MQLLMIVTSKLILVNDKDHLAPMGEIIVLLISLTVKRKIAEGFVCLFAKKNVLQMCSTSKY
jgi:hypothetical protein